MAYLLKLGLDVNSEDYFAFKSSDEFTKLTTRRREFCDFLRPSLVYEGFTALHYAVFSDSLDTVKVLTDAGANPNKTNKLGHKPIDYAREDNFKMIKHLKEYSQVFAKQEAKRQLEERRRFPLEQRLKRSIVG